MATIHNNNPPAPTGPTVAAEPPTAPPKKWWQSTNFYVSAIMVVLGAVIGFSQEIAEQMIGAIFAVIAVGVNVRNLLKGSRFDWKRWIGDSNFWAHLAVVLFALWPAIPEGLLTAVQDLVQAIFTGNFQAIIFAAIPLFNILYKTIFKPAYSRLLIMWK